MTIYIYIYIWLLVKERILSLNMLKHYHARTCLQRGHFELRSAAFKPAIVGIDAAEQAQLLQKMCPHPKETGSKTISCQFIKQNLDSKFSFLPAWQNKSFTSKDTQLLLGGIQSSTYKANRACKIDLDIHRIR